ncbi:inactive rhomboid protein 2 isoform X1 [Diorhabda sublineata]|uniref:inactive rhomboid protein 2 isoform X1 n=1 Tax=Diorhabda sublineata TaxID=1163346 RepID=UPI0024E0458A|nr:inactive rhomboid protein 2 isoform X1 [Diorhabda sublineata]XP_056629628.1 inactive rhomboid protein 2 isoform X1 [Diorhabda sublineata]
MPADDEYGRRQISLPQYASQCQSPSRSVHCPAGCNSTEKQQDTIASHRYPNDKNILDATSASDRDRYVSTERFVQDRAIATEHYGSDRFCSERSNSDRLPSGERYQGVSERYPLGERPQTSISNDRLILKEPLQISGHCQNENKTVYQAERYNYDRSTNTRFPERYTPVQNVGSLDRYHSHNTIDRYSRTSTPTDRYHTLSTEQERNANTSTTERHNSTGSKSDLCNTRERSASSDRSNKERDYQNRYEQYVNDRLGEDRFPAIPCPERFATQERIERPEKMSFSQVSYLEPPSPAPASDRFFPPPPLSPENTPSPDCFSNNTFPSPTTTVPPSERFIPPPPLSPSPTETFAPKNTTERYDKIQRYQGYSSSPNISTDRFYNNDHRYKDRYNHNYTDRYQQNNQQIYTNDKYVNTDGRFNGDRYIPPNAHMPVERYVPQPQEPYFSSYQTYGYKQFNSSDPYMRRDLAFHYRLPIPYSNNYQRIRFGAGTPSRFKCCQYQEGYQICKSSPGSSSSSSVTSQGNQKEVPCVNSSLQEIQCQNFHGKEYFQQEKGIQCGNAQCENRVKNTKGQCRHSICVSPSVEYVGASGGRHVCATPPPRSGVTPETVVCNEACFPRRSQSTFTVTVWRGTPPASIPLTQTSKPQDQPQTPPTQKQTIQRPTTPVPPPPPPEAGKQESGDYAPVNENPPVMKSPQPATTPVRTPVHQRAVSLPPAPPIERPRPAQQVHHRPVAYSQSERLHNRERPALNRQMSRKDMIKNYIKKETANFFGVDEEKEEEQQLRWLDRRKRMAYRTMGPLKEEYCTPSISRFSEYHRRTLSEAAPQPAHVGSGQLTTERPDVLPGPSDITDSYSDVLPEQQRSEPSIRRKESVARMTLDGLSYVVTTLTRHRPRPRSQQSTYSRSFPPDTPMATPPPEEQTFFEKPVIPTSPRTPEGGDTVDRSEAMVPAYRERSENVRYAEPTSASGWRIDHENVVLRYGENRPSIGRTRILSSNLDRVLDNSDRRQYGMGWVGRMFGHSFRKSVTQDARIQEQLDDMEDHRPMFTYWVTTVQILVLFISIICYGVGSFGIDLQSKSGQVLVTSLSLQQVDYLEPANFWFGPRAGDLIHLGAKFAPCMRIDNKIKKEIDKIQAKERETACCIRNDDSGCVQSSQADCSLRGLRPTKTISTWKKWKMGDSGPGGRISGSVCGLDPKFCDAPASVHPYEWPDDITKWPICRKTNTQFSIQKNNGPRDKLAEHMVCEVIGHPCCIGIHGQCKITTKEYCDFVQGTFHEEASLCSQVSCLNDVCGMIPFFFPDVPDQFYRLWTSLFLHAGVLQLVITILIQYFLMRDLEKLTGSLRIGIIYIGSGVAGNLASAIFVPYRADVGPSGSQFGLLACLIVEVLNAWPMLKHPNQALCKLLSITLVLFVVGLLPWVDNYAHLFGFVFGFLLSYAFLPFISFGKYDRHKKIFLIWVCLTAASILFICLVLLFYIIPVYDCKICSYFNCLPITRDFCASQNINFKKEEPIV